MVRKGKAAHGINESDENRHRIIISQSCSPFLSLPNVHSAGFYAGLFILTWALPTTQKENIRSMLFTR
jgi:hypothetical protein